MHGFVKVGSDRLYYRREAVKNKPLVIFIHGLGGKAVFGEEFLQFTNRAYALMTIDVTGRGNSTCHRPVNASLWVNDLKAVLTALQVKECYLVAHSFGGYLSAKLLAWEALKVHGALLVAPYNPFVKVCPGGIRQKCLDLYPEPIDFDTDRDTLQEAWVHADKALAQQFEINTLRRYVDDRDIMVQFRDQAFHDGEMLRAYQAVSNFEIIAAENDDVTPLSSIQALAALHNKQPLVLPGGHDVIIRQMPRINDELNKMVTH